MNEIYGNGLKYWLVKKSVKVLKIDRDKEKYRRERLRKENSSTF